MWQLLRKTSRMHGHGLCKAGNLSGGLRAGSQSKLLAAAGQRVWQLLPIGPTSYGDSPYQSFSAFAGNPYWIDLPSLEQEGLLKRTPGRGTFVCQQNAGRVNRSESRTRRVGVLTTYLDDYIFPGIINGIERVLSRHDYLFTLGLTHNKTLDEATALQKLLADGVDGLIIEGTKTALPTPNEGILQSFRDAGIPMVFINGCYDGANDSYVLMADVQSGELLTQHLIDQGHTQIGGIFKSDDIQGVKRYEGVVKGMQKNNGHIKDDCILWYTTEDVRYLFEGSMDEMILKRLADSTAVVCYNDEIAAKLIDVLRRAGKRVPDDLSVVGFDNSPFAGSQLYNLTTVTYPAADIGETAANVLMRCLEDPEHREHIKIKPNIVERGSVRCLK